MRYSPGMMFAFLSLARKRQKADMAMLATAVRVGFNASKEQWQDFIKITEK